MSKKAIVLLAEGFEEVEAVTPIDYLRRADIDVTVAALGENLTVKGARAGLRIIADILLASIPCNAAEWDAVVIPGGMPGAANLAASNEVNKLVKEMADAGKLVCAICASPAVVLAPLGILDGKRFTCYPGMEQKVSGGKWSEDRVVIDRNIITSRGAGTAGEFSIAIIRALLDEETAKKTADSVLL